MIDDRYLLVRGAAIYATALLVAAVVLWRRPDRPTLAGALLAFAWNLPALLMVHVAAIAAGWWSYDAEGGVLLGMPVDLWLAWAMLWGPVPAIAMPRAPLWTIAALALLIDLVAMPAAAPVVRLGPSWLIGEFVGILACLVPALLLARWTGTDWHLVARASLQVVAFSGLLAWVIPLAAIEGSGSAWIDPRMRPVWVFSLAAQCLAVPAIVGLSAVQEFVTRGRGTPIPFDPPRHIVTTGIYAYVANPMQLSAVLVLFLLAVILGNAWVASAGLVAHIYSVGLAGWDEEEDLRTRFGTDWPLYKQRVRTWIPRWRPWYGETPIATLFVSAECGMCRQVAAWFEARHVRGLAIVPAEECAVPLTRITYQSTDGAYKASGIVAIARALEHIHLGWALAGFAMRLPLVSNLIQLITDASGGGPRRIGARAASLRHPPIPPDSTDAEGHRDTEPQRKDVTRPPTLCASVAFLVCEICEICGRKVVLSGHNLGWYSHPARSRMTKRAEKPDASRRSFLRKAVAGASATAAAALGSAHAQQRSQSATAPVAVAPIRIPAEFAAAQAAAPVTFSFPMTGAQVFARACKEEGVAALFACPGNYPVIHAMASSGIPAYGGRHEGSMAHAADAFIRVTGEIAVASGTEGPGFTDMICAIACANAARTPLLIVASNMSIGAEDTEGGIQLGYQQPTTEGLKKYGKRLIIPRRVHEYAGYAFRQLRSGVPKPVHLDFPAEVASARFKDATELEFFHDKARYRTDARPHPSPRAIASAVEMIRKAQRPIIVSSNGVFYAKAWDALKRVAEKAQIPVVESGAMKGQFSDASPLSANAAPSALASADLVILVGQHCMPTVGEFAFGPDAKYIRIDQAAEDIGRNLPIDLGIVSCELAALDALAEAVPRLTHDSWIAEIAAARRKFEDQNAEYYKIGLGYADAVHPAVIAKELGDFLYRGTLPKEQTTVASGGYGIARFVRRELRAFRPGQIMNGAYQYGAIGPDLGYAVGVAAAVQLGAGPQAAYKGHPIICITGDAGFGYTAMEIDTMAKYKLPVVTIVYNNNAWGTWTGATQDPKAMPIHLFQENLRYDKLAEALGGHGEYVTRPAEFRPALERAYQIAAREGRPSVINCQGKKEFWNRAAHPPGMIGKVEPGVMSYYH